MRKIIFLDFDGVITTMASRYALDRYKCDLLQQVIDLTGAEIVVSSSWRCGRRVCTWVFRAVWK